MECKDCQDELDREDGVYLKVARKKIFLCEDCADRRREEEEIAGAAQSAMQGMMGYRGR